MCKTYQESSVKSAKEAAVELAAIMNNAMNVQLRSDVVMLFVKAYWKKIAPLAHIIHDGD